MQRGNTALHIAALAGHLAVVKLLVERKCDINSKAQGSFTPLYMAAQENHIDVLKYLLSKGADETITTEVSLLPTNHPPLRYLTSTSSFLNFHPVEKGLISTKL